MRVILAALLVAVAIAIPLFLLLRAFEAHILAIIEDAAEVTPGHFPFRETAVFVAQGFLIIFFIVMLVILLFLLVLLSLCVWVGKPYIGGCTYNHEKRVVIRATLKN